MFNLILFPLAYFTTIIAIVNSRQNLTVKLFRIALWIVLGIIILLIKLVRDTLNLIAFLSDY